MKSRRDFVASLTGAGLVSATNVSLASDKSGPDAAPAMHITAETIREAEKLHGVHYSAEQRKSLAVALAGEVTEIEALRRIPRPLSLQPGVHFDPRLPGKIYRTAAAGVHLAAESIPDLPQNEEAIAFATVKHLGHWIRSGQLTSARLTNLYLERIARFAPSLYCFITVTDELARQQAAEMDAELKRGLYRGALHGIPYALKDVFDTAAIQTTWGCSLYRDHRPAEDAAVVKRLRDAGAVLLGKASMGELAFGFVWFGGACRNPWDPAEPAGGSSAGSAAATAAGLCAFSIGTDNLGSILNPADRCGVVGVRPTFGTVPVRGAMPLTPSLERIGPICRSVEDAALVLEVIVGPDPSSAASIDAGFRYEAKLDLTQIRVGYSPSWFEHLSFGDPASAAPVSAAERGALAALEQLGVRLTPVELPSNPYRTLMENLYVESAAVFEELSLSGLDAKLLPGSSWPDNWRRVRFLSSVDYLQIERLRRQVMQQMHELFEQVDVLFAPTYGCFDLIVATNFTGQPGVTLRAGFTSAASRSMDPSRFFLPERADSPRHRVTRNVTFHGRLFEDGDMLAVARALEARLQVQQETPPVAQNA